MHEGQVFLNIPDMFMGANKKAVEDFLKLTFTFRRQWSNLLLVIASVNVLIHWIFYKEIKWNKIL